MVKLNAFEYFQGLKLGATYLVIKISGNSEVNGIIKASLQWTQGPRNLQVQ